MDLSLCEKGFATVGWHFLTYSSLNVRSVPVIWTFQIIFGVSFANFIFNRTEVENNSYREWRGKLCISGLAQSEPRRIHKAFLKTDFVHDLLHVLYIRIENDKPTLAGVRTMLTAHPPWAVSKERAESLLDRLIKK